MYANFKSRRWPKFLFKLTTDCAWNVKRNEFQNQRLENMIQAIMQALLKRAVHSQVAWNGKNANISDRKTATHLRKATTPQGHQVTCHVIASEEKSMQFELAVRHSESRILHSLMVLMDSTVCENILRIWEEMKRFGRESLWIISKELFYAAFCKSPFILIFSHFIIGYRRCLFSCKHTGTLCVIFKYN